MAMKKPQFAYTLSHKTWRKYIHPCSLGDCIPAVDGIEKQSKTIYKQWFVKTPVN